MLGDEVAGVAARRVGQDIGDVALLPQLHRAVAVAGGQGEPHAGEKRAQLIRLRMSEFDEGKAIGPGRVSCVDHGFRGVVREGTHRKLHILLA